MSHLPHKHGGKTSESFINKTLVLEGLDIQSGQSVLDAGCGNGYMSKEFANAVGDGGKVYSRDIHEDSIAKLTADAEGINISVALGDVTQRTDLDDSSVDFVYLSMVFHGFTDDQRDGFVKEVSRVLKPGGTLVIVELDKVETPFGPSLDIRYSPDDLCKAVSLTPNKCIEINEYIYMQTFTA